MKDFYPAMGDMKFRNSLYQAFVNLCMLHLVIAISICGSLGSDSCSRPHNEDGCEIDSSGCGFRACEIDSIGLFVMNL